MKLLSGVIDLLGAKKHSHMGPCKRKIKSLHHFVGRLVAYFYFLIETSWYGCKRRRLGY